MQVSNPMRAFTIRYPSDDAPELVISDEHGTHVYTLTFDQCRYAASLFAQAAFKFPAKAIISDREFEDMME